MADVVVHAGIVVEETEELEGSAVFPTGAGAADEASDVTMGVCSGMLQRSKRTRMGTIVQDASWGWKVGFDDSEEEGVRVLECCPCV